MSYWDTKVLPKLKKLFEKNGSKKAAAADACQSFEEAKEEISKLFEEKKSELQAKVIEIYEASSTTLKNLVKERKEAGLRKSSAAVNKFLEELAKIEFPGSKQVSEASSKFGPQLVSGPVLFIFEKVSTFVKEPAAEEKQVEPSAGEAAVEETSAKDKEIVVEEEKKEEEKKEKEKKEEGKKEEEKKEEEAEKTASSAAPETEKKEESEPPKTT